MPNHLSVLGIIHTAISILAIFAGIIALIKEGVIKPKSTFGKWYVILTVLTCITGFPIMRTGHLGPAHTLTIMVLVLLPLGIYAKQLRVFGKKWQYVQIIIMSATLFLSFVPAVNESFTRLPTSQPLASSPNDPSVKMGLLVIFVLFLTGVIYQVLVLRARRKMIANTELFNS
jgi:Ca2+/Na+ antiporter